MEHIAGASGVHFALNVPSRFAFFDEHEFVRFRMTVLPKRNRLPQMIKAEHAQFGQFP
jgi:hypothetical protein